MDNQDLHNLKKMKTLLDAVDVYPNKDMEMILCPICDGTHEIVDEKFFCGTREHTITRVTND